MFDVGVPTARISRNIFVTFYLSLLIGAGTPMVIVGSLPNLWEGNVSSHVYQSLCSQRVGTHFLDPGHSPLKTNPDMFILVQFRCTESWPPPCSTLFIMKDLR